MLLVLNKFDLAQDLVNQGYELEEFMTYDYLKKFAEDYGFIGAVCTSAKTGQGVTEAVSELVRQILLREFGKECNQCSQQKAMLDQIYDNEEKKIQYGKSTLERNQTQ